LTCSEAAWLERVAGAWPYGTFSGQRQAPANGGGALVFDQAGIIDCCVKRLAVGAAIILELERRFSHQFFLSR
jgi:hypothetical protein